MKLTDKTVPELAEIYMDAADNWAESGGTANLKVSGQYRKEFQAVMREVERRGLTLEAVLGLSPSL